MSECIADLTAALEGRTRERDEVLSSWEQVRRAAINTYKDSAPSDDEC